MNPLKAKTENRLYVSKHRQENPQWAKAVTRQHVAKYRQENPELAKAITRQHVAKHREGNPQLARARTRQHVARHRLFNPEKTRASTRLLVSKYLKENNMLTKPDLHPVFQCRSPARPILLRIEYKAGSMSLHITKRIWKEAEPCHVHPLQSTICIN